MWVLLCVTAVILFLVQDYFRVRTKLKNYPPGPPRLPLLGSLLSIPGELIHLHMQRWRAQYGPVVGLLAGSRRIVTVTGVQEALSVLRHEHCQARPDDFFFRHRSFDQKLGIIFSDGDYWVHQRRYTLRHLRDLGLGKMSLEGVILDEVEETLKHIENVRPLVTPNNLFNAPVLNSLWYMVSGKPFKRNAPAFKQLAMLLAKVLRNRNANRAPVSVWPFLRHIAPEWSGYNEIFPPAFTLQKFIQDEVEAKMKLSKCDGSFMSQYLREMRDGSVSAKDGFTVQSLISICFDLFVAGGETTANTLSFALLYLAMHPDVQARAQRELDAVVSDGKGPVLADRPRLPYVDAVIAEVLRINPIAPITPPHVCTTDVNIGGFTVPKGSYILVSLFGVMNDEREWGDPKNFRPERFLDAEGHFTRNPYLVAFGLGKRVCIGEAKVHQSLFLFLGGLLTRFKFSLPPGHRTPSTIPEPGFTVAPQQFQLLAERRAGAAISS